LFFGISKLFQNKDASLRQMVHLVIKELANSAEDIIMVTSTIMKDTGGSTDSIYRPNAIRALCRIIDVRESRWQSGAPGYHELALTLLLPGDHSAVY
jgi:coatomer protein complex subunit gamma